ncbi:UDP-4-amino-4,6-dideoxy-N-acetyl-beta-L-altrosamine N-acetyltransferase [Psychrobacter sp. Arc29]|uniref:UDP-4-amino-4, 6-dideoxy-N-acetyl-beta-L-altrosamine N-acetyltransferase n=1 Tax=Psychrobacter sp. Arc29 TaxID=3046690 RepID=UPI00352D46EE
MKVDTSILGEVDLLDLTDVSYDIKMCVLKMRNHPRVREQMHSQGIIDKTDHLNFIDSLKNSDSKRYFVAQYKQQLVGVVYFTDINLEEKSATFGIYANLYEKVEKIGSLLMESALTYFHNVLSFRVLNLEVYNSNERAVNLYLKFGFSKSNHFYQNGHDVLIMKYLKRDL